MNLRLARLRALSTLASDTTRLDPTRFAKP